VDELQRFLAEAGGELGAAGVRRLRDLDDGRADLQAGARWEVRVAQVEVDEELVACERPPLRAPGDESGSPGVHQRQLPVRLGALAGALAPSNGPRVADQTRLAAERGLAQELAL